jgi:hypothetical protein
MRFKWVGLLAGCCLLMSGCAKTVTTIFSFGEQMTVEVTLRGDVDISANRYFLVLASSSDLSIPLPPPDNLDYEFIEPGTDPVQGGVADYYSEYYDTWSGYIVLDPGGYYLVKGPFVQSQLPTREALSNLGEVNTKISFSFRLERIFGGTVPDPIYFDFVSVDWPDGQARLSADRLSSTNAYISNVAGSILSVDDGQDPELDPALDIIKCDVEIQ